MKTKTKNLIIQNQIFLYIAMTTGLILLIPWLGMQFTSEINWSSFDFVLLGTLFFGTGSIFVFLTRTLPKKHHLIAGIALFFLLISFLIHIAVGIVDTWPLAGS